MKVNFYDGGYCTHPEFIAIKGGSSKSVKFPALCIVIEHPTKGNILFDTGYSENFYQETRKMPFKLYAKVTPVFVKDKDKVSNKTKDVSTVILSHFHADHIGGVKDFKTATYMYLEHAYTEHKDKSNFSAVKSGFIPGLLPDDFEQRTEFIKNKIVDHFLCEYFENIYDVLGDQSIIGVELPGHAKGQLGIYIESLDNNFFFIADACYLSRTFKSLEYPSSLVNLINDDPKQYKNTIERIHRLHIEKPNIEIIPSHCGDTFKKYVQECNWDQRNLNQCQH